MPDDGDERGLARERLASAAIRGLRWVIVTRAATEVAVLGTSVALARLIPPAEFGRAAIVRIVPMLTVILMFEALGTLLVQRSEAGKEHLSTAALLAFVSGTLLSVLTFFLAPVIADPVFGSRTGDLLELTAATFLLAGLGVVPRAILQRRLDFRRLTLISGIALIVGALASVALAAVGLDAEAIVLGALIALGLESLMLIVLAPPPLPRLHRQAAFDIVRFGLPASLSGAAYVVRRNIDYVVLGAFLPAAAAGQYFRAFQVGAEYQGRVSHAMQLILFPVFSRASDLGAIGAMRVKVMRINALIALPLLTLLVITAPIMIPLVYGQEWAPAVIPAQILAVAGLALALLAGTEAVVLAAGKPQLLLRFNVAFLVAVAIGTAITSSFGLVAVCVAVSVVHVAALLAGQRYLVNRITGIPSWRLLEGLWPAVLPTVALLATATAASIGSRLAALPDAATLGVTIGIGASAYLMCLRTAHASTWAEMRSLASKIVLGPPRPVPAAERPL